MRSGNNIQTQTSEVLKHLKKYRSITSMEAINKFGATRLSSIIFRLRKRGYDIRTVMCNTTTRYGDDAAYAKYTYVKYNGIDNTLDAKRMRGEL